MITSTRMLLASTGLALMGACSDINDSQAAYIPEKTLSFKPNTEISIRGQINQPANAPSLKYKVPGETSPNAFSQVKTNPDAFVTQFRQAASQAPTVHITFNSLGGSIYGGLNMNDAFSTSQAQLVYYCDGANASMSSYLYTANDQHAIKDADEDCTHLFHRPAHFSKFDGVAATLRITDYLPYYNQLKADPSLETIAVDIGKGHTVDFPREALIERYELLVESEKIGAELISQNSRISARDLEVMYRSGGNDGVFGRRGDDISMNVWTAAALGIVDTINGEAPDTAKTEAELDKFCHGFGANQAQLSFCS